MMALSHLRALLLVALASIAVACSSSETPVPEQTAAMPPTPVIVAKGLNGPIGVLVTDDGTVYASDSGAGGESKVESPWPGLEQPVTITWGNSARVVRVAPNGTQEVMANLPSLLIPEGPMGTARLAMFNGELYAASGAWGPFSLAQPSHMGYIVKLASGTVSDVANVWEMEDRHNPEPAHKESNPYDLTVGPDNALWLTDSAGNALYRLNPTSGALELKAVFGVVPGPIPNAARGGAMEIEPVPTAVAFDREGNTYVSLMAGIPFLPGSSRVVRVAADGTSTDYATGLTMLTDLVTGPDGQLYGVSLGQFTEQGPVANSGALLRIGAGTASTPILSNLPTPSSVAFTVNGDAYITTHAIGQPGEGQVVRYAALVAAR
jgi:hypothetical protein